jgi:hypothetical protein
MFGSCGTDVVGAPEGCAMLLPFLLLSCADPFGNSRICIWSCSLFRDIIPGLVRPELLMQNFPGNTPRVVVHPLWRHNHGPHYLMTLRFSAAMR